MSKKIFSIIIVLLLMIPFSSLSNISLPQAENEIARTGYFEQTITTTTFKGETNITTLVGPDYAYDIIINALKRAQTSFYLEVYTLSSEPLVNELIRAKERGVEVIVLLSHDRVSGYEDEYTEEAAYRLDNAGIDVLWTSSEFRFTHAKFWIVDSETVFVYSGNWAPSSIPQYPSAYKNREMGFAITDTEIAAYYEDVFFDDMAESTPYDSSIGHTGNLQANSTSGSYEHPFSSSNFVEYAEVTPIFSPDNSYTLLSSLIKSANTSIDIEMQYILFDCELLQDIIDASQRGVAIRIIINEPDSSGENVTETLLTNGIQVKFFKGLSHNHNKYVSVDGEIVQISSINWSNNSLTNNREAGAIIKNSNIAAYFKQIFDYDWNKGETPEGFAVPVALIDPLPGGIVKDTYAFKASFSVYNYSSAELQIDGSTVHSWVNPENIETVTIDTSSYSDGIHTIKIIATKDDDSTVEIEEKINIININEWLLLISEVRYDAVSEPDGEFVELYNAFDFSLYLQNWKLTDNEGEYKMAEGTLISSEQVLIFARDSSAFVSEMADLGVTGVSADFGLGDISLANTGDEILLMSPDGEVRDAVAWGSGSASGVVTWSGSTGEDKTLQRIPADQDTNDCTIDFQAEAPTPGEVDLGSTNTGTNTGTNTDETNPEFTSFNFLYAILGTISLIALGTIFNKLRK
ncbi:MAG: phospholipase D-like domain-containing protein [Candidatus Heimdallarchaeaceae archaeon]